MSQEGSHIILWWVQSVVAQAEAVGKDDPRYERINERLGTASALIDEAQDLTLRTLQRFDDLKPRLAEAFELLDRLRGKPEEAPEPARKPVVSCSLELVSAPAGPCVDCGDEVGMGVVGWRKSEEPGPLCAGCLSHHSPDLAALRGTGNYLRRSVRGEGEHEHDADPDAPARSRLEMARRFARASSGGWPPRPLGILATLSKTWERMGKDAETFRLSRYERRRGGGGHEPS